LDRKNAVRTAGVAAVEIDRAMEGMRIPGHPRPYYVSALIRDELSWTIQAKYGSLSVDTRDRKRNAYVDVRVGSYRHDQVRDGGLDDNDKDAESYGYVDLPWGTDPDGLRHGLWRLLDARYREAVESLLAKKSHGLTYRDENKHLPSFQRAGPRVDLGWRELSAVDEEHWREFVERSSRKIKRYADIADSHVEFQADHLCRVFANSEGSRLIECSAVWSLEAYLWMLSPRGDAFPWSVRYTVTDPTELPDEKRFSDAVKRAVDTLTELRTAPLINSFSGPALLEPIPAGLLLHEALGHRLEGNRLLASGEGQTFKSALGEAILPDYMTLHDDPTLATFHGRSLVGHYIYDDEGSPAKDARLIERGRLTGYLSGRAGVAKGHVGNGHARSRLHQRPISRMGVLIAETEDGRSPEALKQRLLEEISRQGVPYGVRIVEATSGETATDAYNFQAFMGEVNLVAKVYPDGREQWVRGVNFVGTPLNAVRGILATGDSYGVDNAWCGAESGYVPVSTISPALVVSELELQSKPDTPYTPYTFPIPWRREPPGATDGD
jgi:predicted Zn-dependent protease